MIGYYAFKREKTISSQLMALLKNNLSITVVALMALLIPLLPGPAPWLPWDGASGVAFQVGGALLLAVLLYQTDEAETRHALPFIRRGPTPWLLALLGWGGLSCALTPGAATAQGLLQLASGVLVYTVVAAQTRQGVNYKLLVDTLIGVTILMSLFGIGRLLKTGGFASGSFNHRSLGSFLMVMLPVMLIVGWAPTSPQRRLAAQVAAGLAAGGILLAKWHPSDLGALISLLVLALLSRRIVLVAPPASRRGDIFAERNQEEKPPTAASSIAPLVDLRFGHGSRRRRRRTRSGGLTTLSIGDLRQKAMHSALDGAAILVALALFLTLTYRGAAVRQVRHAVAVAAVVPARLLRGFTSPHEERNLGAREGAASNGQTLAMVLARPFQGWGIGRYTMFQSRFTHQGDEASVVERSGPQPIDRARSLYGKFAVELGLPGLVLWVGSLAMFFVAGGRALRNMGNTPLRQRVLIGCLAAAAGQVVDAISDPSWQFGASALYLWIILGLGMAAAGHGDGLPDAETAETSGQRGGNVRTPVRPHMHLRFAAACAITAVLLSLIIRVAR